MSRVPDVDPDQAPEAETPAATGGPESPEAPSQAAPDPYAGLDEVTRAKRRLLDYARAAEAERPHHARRKASRSAIVAFVAGVVVARVAWLRRGVFRAGRWVARRLGRSVWRSGRRGRS